MQTEVQVGFLDSTVKLISLLFPGITKG